MEKIVTEEALIKALNELVDAADMEKISETSQGEMCIVACSENSDLSVMCAGPLMKQAAAILHMLNNSRTLMMLVRAAIM